MMDEIENMTKAVHFTLHGKRDYRCCNFPLSSMKFRCKPIIKSISTQIVIRNVVKREVLGKEKHFLLTSPPEAIRCLHKKLKPHWIVLVTHFRIRFVSVDDLFQYSQDELRLFLNHRSNLISISTSCIDEIIKFNDLMMRKWKLLEVKRVEHVMGCWSHMRRYW